MTRATDPPRRFCCRANIDARHLDENGLGHGLDERQQVLDPSASSEHNVPVPPAVLARCLPAASFGSAIQ